MECRWARSRMRSPRSPQLHVRKTNLRTGLLSWIHARSVMEHAAGVRRETCVLNEPFRAQASRPPDGHAGLSPPAVRNPSRAWISARGEWPRSEISAARRGEESKQVAAWRASHSRRGLPKRRTPTVLPNGLQLSELDKQKD